jgi:hypothetical protein
MDLRAILKMLKFKTVTPPQLKDDGDFAGNTYYDTQGLAAILFLLAVGTTDVAAGAAIGSTAEATAPLVEECDTTGGSYTAVTGAALANAIQYNEDDKLFGIYVDLTKTHKRYMQIQAPHSAAGAVNGSNLAILAVGFPLDESPRNAAGMGLEELIEA